MALTQQQKDDLTAEIAFMTQRSAQFRAQAAAVQKQIENLNKQIADATKKASDNDAAIANIQALIDAG